MAKATLKNIGIIFILFVIFVFGVFLYTTKHSKPGHEDSRTNPIQVNKTRDNPAPDAADQATLPQPSDENRASIEAVSISLEDLDLMLDSDNLETWSQLSFQDIKNEESFRSFLSRYQLKNSNCDLSDGQKEEFVNHLMQTCVAYHAGTYDEFEKFRMPVNEYTFDSDKLDWYKYSLMNYYNLSEFGLPEEPRELARLYWRKTNESKESFIGLWAAVNTPAVSIHKSGSLPMRLIDMASLLDKSALGGSRLINFERSPSMMLKEQREILYADIEYIVKHKTGLAYPIVIRSFWDHKSEKWLPNEMLICYTGKGRLVDPEF